MQPYFNLTRWNMYTLFCKWIWKKKLNFLKIEDNLKILKLEKLPHFFENGRPQLFKNGRNLFSSNERPHFFKNKFSNGIWTRHSCQWKTPSKIKKTKNNLNEIKADFNKHSRQPDQHNNQKYMGAIKKINLNWLWHNSKLT